MYFYSFIESLEEYEVRCGKHRKREQDRRH